MPGNIRVIVVGSGIGELVRTPEMAYKARLLPSPNWSEAIQFEEASAAKPYPEQHVPSRTEHHHSGLGLLTPEVVHMQRSGEVRERRQQTLHLAYAAHPERFVRKPPQPPALPTEVWINPPRPPESGPPPDSEQKTQ
jgi:hypothetical protein